MRSGREDRWSGHAWAHREVRIVRYIVPKSIFLKTFFEFLLLSAPSKSISALSELSLRVRVMRA